uniref:Uncharacterized protein n=1 Tax=Zooxanthella nutricula TaxID=1333877 RepID=A0A7S2NT87_9DINO
MAIVSHSNFLRTTVKEACGCGKEDAYFDNNAAKSVSYTFSFKRDGSEVKPVSIHEDAGSCEVIDFQPLVWHSKETGIKRPYLCQADYHRCSTTSPKAMGLTEEGATARKESPSIVHPDQAQHPGHVCCTDLDLGEPGIQDTNSVD